MKAFEIWIKTYTNLLLLFYRKICERRQRIIWPLNHSTRVRKSTGWIYCSITRQDISTWGGSTGLSKLLRYLIIMANSSKERLCGSGAPISHVNGFPPSVYPFAFSGGIRSSPPFEMLANGSFFRNFPTDLPKEMASLCEYALTTYLYIFTIYSLHST